MNDGTRPDGAARPVPHSALGRGHRDRPSTGPGVSTAVRDTLAAGVNLESFDVICAGMYRACSTWQFEVVAHLVEQHRRGRRLGYLTAEQYGGSPEVPPQGWRVFKSHDGDRRFAASIAQGRAVAIYAYRDVRDVVFSLMHKRRWTFEQLLRQGMIHQVLANDRFWTGQSHVLVQRYDEILADPVASVRALATHLGIEPSEGEAEQIAEEYSLAANKARADALRHRLEQGGVDLNEAANSQICDASTMLHWNHVRDGRSGSWMDESTPRQRLILHRLCGRWLRSRGYSSRPQGDRQTETTGGRARLGEKLGIEVDILRGWLSYQTRTASQRFPRLATTGKRMLGIANPSQVGAVVWSESQATKNAGGTEPRA
jgi:Sulfotransferase domain